MNKTDEELNLAEAMAKRHGVRMCDENGDTHGEELYCVGIDDIADIIREALVEQVKQEPVAWVDAKEEGYEFYGISYLPVGKHHLYAAPVQPVNQELVVVGYLDVGEGGYLGIGTDLTDDQIRERLSVGKHNLYAAPVDAKAIRAEALKEAEEIAKTIGGSFADEFLAATRELK